VQLVSVIEHEEQGYLQGRQILSDRKNPWMHAKHEVLVQVTQCCEQNIQFFEEVLK
jgi:hypothetical protein